MIYLTGESVEPLGAETDTSMEHAIDQGMHDAISTTIRYTVVLAAAILAVNLFLGPLALTRVLKHIGGK